MNAKPEEDDDDDEDTFVTCLLDDMVASDGLEAVLEELTSIVRHKAFMSGIGNRRNALYRVAHLLADAHDAAQEIQEEDY